MFQKPIEKKMINDNVCDFMDYKKKKPFFKKRMKITLGSPMNATYFMLKNMVFMGRQILALKAEQDPGNIVLVEAEIVDGQLARISRLPDEVLDSFNLMLSGTAIYTFNQNKNELQTKLLEF